MEINNGGNINLATKSHADSYLYLFASTFLYYDHLLTLQDEVVYIWSRPNTVSSGMFFVNRYFSFTGNILILLSMFMVPSEVGYITSQGFEYKLRTHSCHPWEELQEFFHAFVQVIVAILLTLRIYAIYGRDRRVIIGLAAIIVFGIGATVASLAFSESTPVPSPFPIGCHDVLNTKNAALVAVGWEAVLIYDTLLSSMTLFKAYQARFQPKPKEMKRLSLLTIIMRDGTIYFGIMALTNLVNVLTFYASQFPALISGPNSVSAGNWRFFTEGYSVTFRELVGPKILHIIKNSDLSSCSTSVTLMSRLILHLHKVTDKGSYVCYGDTLARPTESYTPDWTMSVIAFHHDTRFQDTMASSHSRN
ncbi:hypothetical protein BDP27DRAFT_1446347 [Rhodocollybia butyracea]|uniref:DUF6533 domain-containing protein n=1 Tax=Rhodocollybia butyracea TaxID=206335 RepID=A0A9P5PY85_9AGAR|nr:hypothetical protein BDP27DRAFT_1446347 [Rhodocollybia butyracea]